MYCDEYSAHNGNILSSKHKKHFLTIKQGFDFPFKQFLSADNCHKQPNQKETKTSRALNNVGETVAEPSSRLRFSLLKRFFLKGTFRIQESFNGHLSYEFLLSVYDCCWCLR